MEWLEHVDPGTHRRIRGLRLVTAYGIAAMLGAVLEHHQVANGGVLSSLAGGFALWASVSEGQTTRAASSRDLLLLCAAAVAGAVSMIGFGAMFRLGTWLSPEAVLITGAFLVGYLKRFGTLGAGVGSQVYIGQLLAYGASLHLADTATVVLAGVVAAVAAIVPRVLSGPAERPVSLPISGALELVSPAQGSRELRMGLQAALAALIIVLLSAAFHLEESAWAITACTYVIGASAADTLDRVRRRILGTLVGVPLGLMLLPVAAHAPLVLWLAAALAMVVYAMALPERYDVACGAYAFTLMVTLAATGERSSLLLAARAWETLIGGAIGLTAAVLVLPLRPQRKTSP
ncbi:FUSC family protein [Methylobacterium oryzae]|uniref:FUSC family protein n=1 Tax=Methylobacterium oryzae TaxID=334852 RepID=UPI002F35A42C